MTAPAVPRILIRQLAMEARIGVHDWEKEAPQPVVLDLELDLSQGRACISDRLEDTVDYAAVIERIRHVAMQPHALAEALAHGMCACVLADPDVLRVRLTLMKLAPYPGAQVGVVLEREQSPPQEFKLIEESRDHQYL